MRAPNEQFPPQEWGSQQPGPQEEPAGMNLGRAILSRKLFICLLAVLGAGFGYLYYLKTPPTFISYVKVRVQWNRPPIFDAQTQQVVSPLRDKLPTDVLMIRSHEIVGRAANDPLHNLAQLASISDSNPEGSVMGGLNARQWEDGSEILQLSFKGPVAEDCPKVLAAVVDAYKAYLLDSQKSSSSETLNLITQAKDDLLKRLNQADLEYSAFKQQTQLVMQNGESLNIHAARLAKTEDERADLQRARQTKQARLDAINEALKRGGSREAIRYIIAQDQAENSVNGENSSTNVVTEIMRKQIEKEILLSRGLGENHSKVHALTTEIELMRSLLQAETDRLAQPGVPQRDILAIYLDALTHELSILDSELKELDALFITQQAAAKALAAEENQNRQFLDNIDRTKQLFNVVLAKLDAINLAGDSGGITAAAIESMDRPGGRLEPNLYKSLGMGAAAGMALAALLAILFEMRDLSFRDAAEVGRELGATVIGHIPVLEARSSRRVKDGQIDKTIVAHHKPKSRQAEAYRNVRTALMMSARDKHTVLQMTSPDPGDGKTTLTSNMAVVIAKAGKRCLLVDCDLRRPRIHKVFGLTNTKGLSSIIVNQTDLPDVAHRDVVPMLDIISAGPRVDDPAELLHSPRFAEFIEMVREQYDFVLLDSPPLLAVSESSTVAGVADGVVLVVRIGRHNRPVAKRAREILDIVGARILGVVVNAVESGSKYGQYGSYGYGYGYGGYGYGGYRYGGGAYNSYYEPRGDEGLPALPAPARSASQN